MVEIYPETQRITLNAGASDGVVTYTFNVTTTTASTSDHIEFYPYTTSSGTINISPTDSTTQWYDLRGRPLTSQRTINQGINFIDYNFDGVGFVETEADRQARIETERKRRQQRLAAEARAEELLRKYLSQEQKVTLDKHGWFEVNGKSGTLYRIRKGRSINVDVLDKKTKQVVHKLCAHPVMNVPDFDTMLTQKVMLEVDEASFLKVARKWAA